MKKLDWRRKQFTSCCSRSTGCGPVLLKMTAILDCCQKIPRENCRATTGMCLDLRRWSAGSSSCASKACGCASERHSCGESASIDGRNIYKTFSFKFKHNQKQIKQLTGSMRARDSSKGRVARRTASKENPPSTDRPGLSSWTLKFWFRWRLPTQRACRSGCCWR